MEKISGIILRRGRKIKAKASAVIPAVHQPKPGYVLRLSMTRFIEMLWMIQTPLSMMMIVRVSKEKFDIRMYPHFFICYLILLLSRVLMLSRESERKTIHNILHPILNTF